MGDPNALVGLFSFPSSSVCFAYLDPASGAILLQLVLGGIGSLAIILRFGWRRIAASLWFSKGSDEAVEDSSDAPVAESEASASAPEEAHRHAA